jgi:hypothetical protein
METCVTISNGHCKNHNSFHMLPQHCKRAMISRNHGRRLGHNSSRFPRGNAVALDNRSNHDLFGIDMLAPPGHAIRSFSPIPQNFNQESWNIFNLRAKGVDNDRTAFDHSNGHFRYLGHGPGSIGSAAPRSDSGYNSQSVISHDAGRMEQIGSHCGLSQQVISSNARSITTEAPPMIRIPSDQRSHASHISSRSETHGNPLECRVCGVVSKCNSDLKYVPNSCLIIHC